MRTMAQQLESEQNLCSLQLDKPCMQQQRPCIPKNNLMFKKKKFFEENDWD